MEALAAFHDAQTPLLAAGVYPDRTEYEIVLARKDFAFEILRSARMQYIRHLDKHRFRHCINADTALLRV
jgi:hypothetical protein